ncbi:hypothetical protein Y032_0288g1474 [Ancylostoma ceylanicum]|uniref:Uncharacterized protein n=1 Tax=Ancylostoma ceylanicum TaxID=53326 RepID=A0A016S612_9BILA|nr:hypothetical protein Y032_0288g1474 [Ancylostoma ceylanicum]
MIELDSEPKLWFILKQYYAILIQNIVSIVIDGSSPSFAQELDSLLKEASVLRPFTQRLTSSWLLNFLPSKACCIERRR